MQIILQKTVSNLGFVGDVVNVRDGYFRNFLSPRGLALSATKGSIAQIEHQNKVIEAKKLKAKSEAAEVQKRLEALQIELQHAAGEGDKLFGSITSQEITAALKEKGFELDKKQITIEEPIKTLGEHTVSVKLHPEVHAAVKVTISRKADAPKETHQS